MNNWISCITGIFILYCLTSASAQPRPQLGCLAIMSRSASQFEQNIGSGLRLVYRGPPVTVGAAFYLASENNHRDSCGRSRKRTVYAKLPVPDLPPGQWIAISFDCENPQKTVTAGQPLIGIFRTSDSTVPTKAIGAWTVNAERKAFVPVTGVFCRSFDK